MAASVEDKLFFVNELGDKIARSVIVDFGCADGTMTMLLSELYPNATVIGYDISETMIGLAKSKMTFGTNVKFTDSWSVVEDILNEKHTTNKVLVLSSVIHEVYSYSSEKHNNTVSMFWNRVTGTGFDYVIIRDMSMDSTSGETKPLDSTIRTVNRTWHDSRQLAEFEERYGKISDSNLNLYHFLIKSMWTANWNREVCEDYFPLTTEGLMKIMGMKYNLLYFSHCTIPFIVNRIKSMLRSTYNIDLDIPTHIKCIYQKKRA